MPVTIVGRPAGNAGDGVEIEVKLSVARPSVVLARLARDRPERLAGFERVGRLHRVEVLDRYLDTADGALERGEARARLREAPEAVRLTVKRRGVVDGALTTRVELEGPATAGLDPAAWPPSAARDLLMSLAHGAPLLEIARLRQRRAIRLLRREDTVVEASLDHLEALDGDLAVAGRWELEAELKAGDRRFLQELAEALSRIPGVGPALGSKRGFAIEAVAPPSGAPTSRASIR